MITHLVKFTSTLSEAEVMQVARDREGAYRATPGLVQKVYIKFGAPKTYGGFMIWESAEALAAFRETELARSVPEAYGVDGVPEVLVGEGFMLLRDAEALIPT
jgi:heme-degrading monooxygenase HmoA